MCNQCSMKVMLNHTKQFSWLCFDCVGDRRWWVMNVQDTASADDKRDMFMQIMDMTFMTHVGLFHITP